MQQENRVILAQKRVRPVSGVAFWRLAAFVLLPFIGMVAAFGIAPDTDTEPVNRMQVVQEIALPLLPLTANADVAVTSTHAR